MTLLVKRLHRRLRSYTEYRNVENLRLKRPFLFVFLSEDRLTCRYSSRVIVPSLSVSCMLNKTAEKGEAISLTATDNIRKHDHMIYVKTHISISPSWRSHAAPLSCAATGAWNETWRPGTPQSRSPRPSLRHSGGSFWGDTANYSSKSCLWQSSCHIRASNLV